MKFPGSIGVMIIVISFLSVSFISAIEMTPTYKEEINYNFVSNDVFNTESNKSPEYKDYIIPEEKDNKNTQQNIILYNKDKLYFKQKAALTNSEITPLKTILNSLNYSKNCESITIDLNLQTEKIGGKWYIQHPITPILCIKEEDHFIPICITTGYNDVLHDITFNYKIGDSVIYLKNFDKNMKYTGSNGINLPIDTLFIGHHYNNLLHITTHQTDNVLLESNYKIKWCENASNAFSNPFIDIEDKYPNAQYCKINLKNFTTYGDKIIINADSFNIINNNQVSLGDINKLFTINDIDIIYQDQKCLLKFNDINVSKDLGPLCNHKILLEGDWAFESQYYEGHVNKEITGHTFNTNPFAIFQMNNTNLVGFIGIVIIFSGLYALSIGLSLLDWAVILSVIAFILITV